ncbi:MAG: hypothetical protein A2556_01500 [Candidatus Vogelbacteria bacterium RIFOXYD2_FULL_44_9]|uniref:Uncharacterized protein n=1 Tax=Candidatus Vogelbacteria bacterium RIFOXYD2_FULL_44_9 TaxID=1802441 RepID=A0A1G2QM86_9BACT|nr:MAG: hypothetical protein A2556_01500 [Candidatus Vogelbacteria bacterium RIFOXYD2_FULL_44_9]
MAIERDKFLALKPFDHVIDHGGRMGHTWIVQTVVDGPDGKEILLRRRNDNFDGDAVVGIICRWDEAHKLVVDAQTGHPADEFNGSCAFIPPESVERVVEEMLASGRLNPEEADRLNKAGGNNTFEGIAIGCD